MNVRSKPNREREAPAEPERDGSELPKGWVLAVLSSLCDRQRGVSYGRDDARSEPADGLIPILRANNIDGDRLNFNDLVYVPRARVSENQQLRPGDVVIAMSSGSKSVVGKTAQIIDVWNGSFGAFCGVLRPHSEIDAQYFGLFLRTREYRQAISELSAGTNINNLKAEHFDAIQVPIAPLAEQRRIVGKLELLLGKVSSSQQRLSRVPGLLKRFRQSVLAAACSGKLTADWREENPADEAVSTYCPDYEVPTIPSTWKWCEVQEVGDVKSGKRLPKGRELVSEDTGHLYLRAGNLKDGTVRCDGLLFVPTDVWPKIKNYTVVGGDVYITIVGACIGDAGVIPEHLSGANLTENAAKVCNLRGIASFFLSNWLRSQYCQAIIQQNILSAAQGKLALFRIQQLPTPLPPLAEQQEIVRRVEKLFAFADQIEARLRQAQAHVDRLTQSLLAKAFRGELVPTEHTLATREGRDYEPASALLERIRVMPARAATAAKRSRRQPAE